MLKFIDFYIVGQIPQRTQLIPIDLMSNYSPESPTAF